MKKKSKSSKKEEKAKIKEAKSLRKKYSTTMEWSNIEMVDGNAILLKDGNKKERVIGIKITPRNIYIDTNHVKSRVINNLRIMFNKLPFEVYWGFVFIPVSIDDHLAELLKAEDAEEDPRVKSMIKNDFEKAIWFQDVYRELEFYIMIKNKNEKQLMKNFDQLISEFYHAGFETKTLNYDDMYNYIAYIYENPMINDYYFSRGVFSCLMDEIPDIVDEMHEPEFDYDDYYEREDDEDEYELDKA